MSTGADELIGQVVANQFRVERKLGEGGMGAVYLADQLEMERKVVLKVMHAHTLGTVADFGGEERFKREARIVAQLNHPNVVQVHAFGRTDGGQPYIAMEYVEGRTLADVLREHAPLPEARALRILDQVLSALIEAHERGLVHRDLKPENIMLSDRHGNADHVKVLDFGIATMRTRSSGEARLTKVGAVIGTAEYMAPEQARAQPVDQRTDIYALGVILYEMLTSRLPFSADNVVDYLVQQVSAPVELPTRRFPALVISPRAEAIVARAVEKNPANRFPSAADMQREVHLSLAELLDRNEIFTSSSASFDSRRPSSSGLAAKRGPGTVAAEEGTASGAVAGGTAALAPVKTGAEPATDRNSSAPDPATAAAIHPATTAAIHPAGTAAIHPTATLSGAMGEVTPVTGAERGASTTGIPGVPAPSRARRRLLIGTALLALAGGVAFRFFGPFPRFGSSGLYLPPGARLIAGLPVPQGTELNIESPDALMVYVTTPDPHSIFDFYLHQAQAWGPARRDVNIIYFTDDRAPVSHVNVSGQGSRFLVVLARNLLHPSPREPAPAEIFGAPLPPGAISALLMAASATYNVPRPTLEVMAFYKEKVGTAPDLIRSENWTESAPSLSLMATGKTRGFAQISVIPTPPSMRPSEGIWAQVTVVKRTQ